MKGLVITYTGNGKGKTSAAIGAVIRTLGSGGRVAYIQFMKGSMESSERDFFANLGEEVKVFTVGTGFFRNESQRKEQEELASKGIDLVKRFINDKSYDLIVLDEINNVLHHNLVRSETVESIIENRDSTSLVLTGRNAPDFIIEMSDTVSELKEIKHAYQKGIPAQKGIDF